MWGESPKCQSAGSALGQIRLLRKGRRRVTETSKTIANITVGARRVMTGDNLQKGGEGELGIRPRDDLRNRNCIKGWRDRSRCDLRTEWDVVRVGSRSL